VELTQETLSASARVASPDCPWAVTPHLFAPRICYKDCALFPRHSFAEIKRMHGQKPLWSPGAWHEYLSTAWLPARCPQVHISRASSGEAAAGRPRTLAAGFVSCKFLLVTVPLSLCTPGAILARPRDVVPHSLASAQVNIKAPEPEGPEGGSEFWGRSWIGMNLPFSCASTLSTHRSKDRSGLCSFTFASASRRKRKRDPAPPSRLARIVPPSLSND